ncbi:MAG: PTS sugar transporter subunit IIB [Gemmatimonadota bacterium]|nr:PTS sugar transporter subunit IIB [Gemmatimonadota bacterium]
MPLELIRIDERLIHGQVVVGWGTRLGLSYYIVVDDALAASGWEQELYRSALPDGVVADFMTTEDAIRRFAELDARHGAGALLTRGTMTMRAIAEAGLLTGRRVNVGGLHDGEGRDRIADYLCLGPAEREDLSVVLRSGASVTGRDLPTAPVVPLDLADDAGGE